MRQESSSSGAVIGAGLLSPTEIVDKINAWGQAKVTLSFEKMMGLGVLAGLFISFGATFALLVLSNSALGFGPTRLLAGLVFSLGLMLVVVTGVELSTGNCLLVVPWATRRMSTGALLRNWGLSFLANGAGAVVFALLVAKSGLLDPGDFQQTAKRIAESKLALEPIPAFVRGMLCNMLVCLAVWMSFASTTAPGKMFAVMMPIAAFVALGFEHSVANVYLLPLGIMAGASATAADFTANIVMVTLGNLVGGAAIGWLLGQMHGRAQDNAATSGDATTIPGVWRHRFAAATIVAVTGWLLFSPRSTSALAVTARNAPLTIARGSNVQPADVQVQLQTLERRHEASDLVTKQLLLSIENLGSEIAQLRVATARSVAADQLSRSSHELAFALDDGRGAGSPARGDTHDARVRHKPVLQSCPGKDALKAEELVLHFTNKQDTLDREHRRQLDRLATLATGCLPLSLTVHSHTDNRGPERMNQQLSRHRGHLIAAHLTARGIDAERIRVIEYGARLPLLPNDNVTARATNRRAEIKLDLQ